MLTTKRLLATFIVAVLLTGMFGTTAYASELLPTETQSVQDTTEEITNTEELSQTDFVEDNTDIDVINSDSDLEENSDVLTEEDSELEFTEEDATEEQAEDNEELEEAETVKKEIDEKTSDKSQKNNKKTKEEKKPSYSEEDLRLLACLVYAEAGNQSYSGMLGVANVVLNRVKSDSYWHVNTIKEVIYDKKWSVQFAVTVKNKKTGLSALDKALQYYDTGKFPGSNPEAEREAMNRAIKAAKHALEGKNNIGDYLCFQNKRSAKRIKKQYSEYKIIGDHIFYRTK